MNIKSNIKNIKNQQKMLSEILEQIFEGVQCIICMENFNWDNKRPFNLLPCTHAVCKECIRGMVDHSVRQCPLCRQKLKRTVNRCYNLDQICHNIDKVRQLEVRRLEAHQLEVRQQEASRLQKARQKEFCHLKALRAHQQKVRRLEARRLKDKKYQLFFEAQKQSKKFEEDVEIFLIQLKKDNLQAGNDLKTLKKANLKKDVQKKLKSELEQEIEMKLQERFWEFNDIRFIQERDYTKRNDPDGAYHDYCESGCCESEQEKQEKQSQEQKVTQKEFRSRSRSRSSQRNKKNDYK